MRRPLVLSVVVAASAFAVLACSSFAKEVASTPEADGAVASGDGGAGAGETCTVVLDEPLATAGGQLTELSTQPGGSVTFQGGALVATVLRGSGDGEAQLATRMTDIQGTFTRARLSFTLDGIASVPDSDSIRVGCTLKLGVTPTGSKDQYEAYLRVAGTNLKLGGFDVVDAGAGNDDSLDVLKVSTSATTLRATLETVAGGVLASTATVDGRPATDPVRSTLWSEAHGWQLKCGIDEAYFGADAGVTSFTIRVKDVTLSLCTKSP